MAHIFYAPRDPGEASGTMAGYEKWNANKAFANHFYNVHALSHIAKSTPDFREKQQAEAEIIIGERRKLWWQKHPNFEMTGALRVLKSEYGLSI